MLDPRAGAQPFGARKEDKIMRHGIFTSVSLALSLGAFTLMATPGPLSVMATFDPAAAELPESVTLDDDGTFYMSMERSVRRLSPGGNLEVLADIPIPEGAFVNGVKIGPNGDVYAVRADQNRYEDGC